MGDVGRSRRAEVARGACGGVADGASAFCQDPAGEHDAQGAVAGGGEGARDRAAGGGEEGETGWDKKKEKQSKWKEKTKQNRYDRRSKNDTRSQ